MTDTVTTPAATEIRPLAAEPLTPEAFAPFGTVIAPIEDGVPFGPEEAQLDLSRGTPRLYIMRLDRKGLDFGRITRHCSVTQCLAAMGGKAWYLGVAAPKDPEDPDERPAPEDIHGFLIPGTVAVKLHRGTWHAGPFFEDEEIAFLNLELADTNEVDHQNHEFARDLGITLRFAP